MDTEELILSCQVRVNGKLTTATLSTGGQLQWAEKRLDVEKEVLGFSANGCEINIRAVVRVADGICCFGADNVVIRRSYVLEFLSDESLHVWSEKFQKFIDSLGRPKRLYIFVNPHGGKKSALEIFAKDVKPLLDDANVDYTVQETKYQLHAKEAVESLDLSRYNGIICVSGDGILVEVLNGLLSRKDWSSSIKMPLGIVPAGTGNGMAKSLLDSCGEPCAASNATLLIIRGHRHPLDVATISQGNTRFFSLLMMAWGLVADIDIESEKFRWMGGARFDVYGLIRALSLRKYDGSIFFVPAPGYESYGEPLDLENIIAIEGKCENIKTLKDVYEGPNFDLKNLNWRKIDGPFVSVWLHNVPWGSETTMAAPDAKFSDGYLDLIMTRDCPKFSLLKLLTEMNNGDHVKSPYVSYLKVQGFLLQPGPQTGNPEKSGIIDVDGEVIARGVGAYKYGDTTLMNYDKLLIEVDKGLATLFAPNCCGI